MPNCMHFCEMEPPPPWILQMTSILSPFFKYHFHGHHSNSANPQRLSAPKIPAPYAFPPPCHTMPKPKHTRKQMAKALHLDSESSSDSEEPGPQSSKRPPKACCILWTVARTEWLLDWLDENPKDHQKLFSDSSKNAKNEGQRKRVAKGTKSEFHKIIATFVFSVDPDPDIHADFAINTINYTKSVDNYIIRWVVFFKLYFLYAYASLTGCGKSIASSMRILGNQVLAYDMKIWRREVMRKIWSVSGVHDFRLIKLITTFQPRKTWEVLSILKASAWVLAHTAKL